MAPTPKTVNQPRRRVVKRTASVAQTSNGDGSEGQPELPTHRIALYAVETVTAMGAAVRRLRLEQQMTLQTLSARTGLSASMLSMVERGRTSPSIGTLITIASALRVHMSELFGPIEEPAATSPITRVADQPKFETAAGVVRRLACNDVARGIEFVVNEYEPGTSSSSTRVHHGGIEYGILIEGTLSIDVGPNTYEMAEGDSISYESAQPHRIVNTGETRARAVWLNLER